MSPTTFAAGLALLTSIALGQQPARPFTSGAELVVVPTVVLNRQGGMVPTLKVEDFRVTEDGAPVTIETFVPPAAPGAGGDGRFIVLVLDNLRTRAELGPRVQSIARKFTDRMGPSDVLSVVTLTAGRSFTTASRAEAQAAISRFRPAFGDTIRSEAEDAARGLTAIGQLTQQMAAAPHRRKVLVFIGAPGTFSPREESAFHDRGPELGPLWFEAIRSTARDNASVYVIDPEGLGQVEDYSQSFAAETGGSAWVNSNNFDRAVNQIWLESGSYYLLGYPAPINDHRIHKIEVRVTVPGVTIRARRARG